MKLLTDTSDTTAACEAMAPPKPALITEMDGYVRTASAVMGEVSGQAHGSTTVLFLKVQLVRTLFNESLHVAEGRQSVRRLSSSHTADPHRSIPPMRTPCASPHPVRETLPCEGQGSPHDGHVVLEIRTDDKDARAISDADSAASMPQHLHLRACSSVSSLPYECTHAEILPMPYADDPGARVPCSARSRSWTPASRPHC